MSTQREPEPPTFGVMPNALPFKLLGPNICYSMFWPHFSPLRVQGIHVTRNITMTYQNRIGSAEVEWMQNSYKMCHTTIILWKLEWQQRIMLYRMLFEISVIYPSSHAKCYTDSPRLFPWVAFVSSKPIYFLHLPSSNCMQYRIRYIDSRRRVTNENLQINGWLLLVFF